jgi:hypothetical protein
MIEHMISRFGWLQPRATIYALAALAALKGAARRGHQGYVLDAVQVRAAGHDIVGERGFSAMKFNRQQLRP